MNTESLFDLVNNVNDEKSYIEFIEALRNDRVASCKEDPNAWQNNSIEDFLASAYEWAKNSVDGLKHYEKPINPWKRCAQILYMGKIYE